MAAGDGVTDKLVVDPEPGAGEASAVNESLDDYTAPTAHGRTLFVNLKFLRFGIDDKTLALASVLTFLLLVFLLIFGVISIFSQSPVIATIIDGLIKALFMALGVVVGRKASGDD